MNEIIEYMIKKYNRYIKEAIMQESFEKMKQASGIRKELTGMELALACMEEELVNTSHMFKDPEEIMEYAHSIRHMINKIHNFKESLYE